jgi:stalled ribosome rescue protein Dom34
MKTKKNVGVWMDHSKAQVIDNSNMNEHATIHSNFNFTVKEEALNRSENLMHNKEQQAQHKFHKQIADKICEYDNVLLFGPTDAKLELKNYLNDDVHFKNKQIIVQTADQMTENEKNAYVTNHFNH